MTLSKILKRVKVRPKKIYVILHPGRVFVHGGSDYIPGHPLVREDDYPVPNNLKKRGE